MDNSNYEGTEDKSESKPEGKDRYYWCFGDNNSCMKVFWGDNDEVGFEGSGETRLTKKDWQAFKRMVDKLFKLEGEL